MKTKFLLSALCLPTIFAACNSEEILVNNDVVSDMPANRAVVELNVNAGVDSRMTMENGAFAWEETDKIGSVLVDPTELWTVDATKTVGNNRWDYNDGRFSTQGTTVEGAWMFYFPYDPAVSSSRNGVKVTKSIQYQNYDPDGKLMAANDFRVSPIYFVNAAEGGAADIDVRFNSVYSYGLIDATFPTDVVVDKVLIKAEGTTEFNDKLLIKPALIAAQSAMNYAKEANGKQENDVITKPYGFQWTKGNPLPSKNETWVPNALNAEYALQNWAADKEYNVESIQPIVEAQTTIDYILVRCGEGVATSSKKFTTNVLLPADVYTTTDVIDVYFYTDKGVYKYEKVASSTYDNANLLMKRGCTVQLHNVNKVAEVTNPVALAPTTIATTNSDITTDPYIIDNKDLVAVINSVTTTKEISPKLLGTITIDDAVASALEANAKVTKLNVALDNIDVTCAAKNISKLFTAGKVTLKNGANVTFKGGQIKELLVEAGATATLEANIGVDDATATVKGTLNLANKIGKYTAFLNVDGGNLNIGTAVAADVAVPTIQGYVKDIKSGNMNVNVKFDILNSSAVPTFGLTEGTTEMNVTFNENVTSTIPFVLQSTTKLTNNATLLHVATNDGEIDNYGTLNVTTNNVIINNYGIATIGTSEEDSYINQYDAEAEVEVATNKGTIDAIIDGCETTVGENNGEIIIANLAKLLVTTNNGDISFSAPEGFKATDFSDLDNTITKIIINEDFTYDYSTDPNEAALATLNTGVKKLQFAGNLTLRKDWALNANSEVSFVGEKVMIQGKFTLSNARTMNFGVQEVKSSGGDVIVAAVYTDAQIAQGTTITGLVNLNLLGTAQKTAEVWNSGVVDAHFTNEVVFNGDDHYKPAKADGWKGNPIK